jgi:hypothetical protein
MPNLQAIKTKTKHVFQTDEVQVELLEVVNFLQTLNEEQVNFILAQYLKNRALEAQNTKKKKKNTLPPHIKQGIKESLEDYEKGNYVVLEPGEEMTMENIRQKFKMKFAK